MRKEKNIFDKAAVSAGKPYKVNSAKAVEKISPSYQYANPNFVEACASLNKNVGELIENEMGINNE